MIHFLVVDVPETGGSTRIGIGPRYEVQDNCIVFKSDFNGDDITVEYLGLVEDDDGFVMVGENHIEAIVAYIMFKYAARSRFSPDKMTVQDRQLLLLEYENLVTGARADDSELTESERQEIVNMLHDPFSGYGLETGMFNNNDSYYGGGY